MDYLPSPKTAISGLLLVACVVTGLWFAGKNKKDQIFGTRAATSTPVQALNTVPTTTEAFIRSLIEENGTSSVTVAASSKAADQDLKLDNLKLSNDNSQEAIHSYGVKLGVALKPFAQASDNEAKLAVSALDNRSTAEVAKLVSAREMREQVFNKLKSLAVPSSASETHLALTNNIKHQIFLLRYMEQVLTQPKPALQAAVVYLKETQEFYRLVGEVNKYFSGQKIIFTDKEKMNIYVNL